MHRPKLCMFASLSFFLFLIMFKEKTSPVGSRLFLRVSVHLRGAHGPMDLIRRPKLHQQERCQNFSWKENNVLDLTVSADYALRHIDADRSRGDGP